MADFTHSPMSGGFSDDMSGGFGAPPAVNSLTKFTNFAGAALSVALVIGIGVWGYKLLVRDVSGIPVVRAAEGEMRVRPEEPGGLAARHQGLSVNEVAALGTAAAPADRLILAPAPIDLTAEDQVIPTAMVAPVPQAQDPAEGLEAPILDADEVIAALEAGNVDDIVAQLTAGVAPIVDLEAPVEDVIASVTEAVVAEVSEAEQQLAALAVAPGVQSSLRPQKRPARRPAPVAPVAAPAAAAVATTELAAAPAAPAQTDEVDAASLPAGTRLAQLGAFESAEIAREQWGQLRTRFEPFMAGKTRIVQRAKSGGRVFYRLRAQGFTDIADARRFCSALVAKNADCIPVVTR